MVEPVSEPISETNNIKLVKKKEKKFKCECGKAFEIEYLLIRHMKDEFICPKIKKQLNKERKLREQCTCENCNKKISNKYNLKKHLKICGSKNKKNSNEIKLEEPLDNIPDNNTVVDKLQINNSNDITITDHYIYIIHVREFIRTKESIYKIGKTTQKNFNRFFQYPKGSKLLFYMNCIDCHKLEKQIIKLFRKKYKLKSEYGNEYFEGEYLNMIIDITNLVIKDK
jgi:hypothetical protein